MKKNEHKLNKKHSLSLYSMYIEIYYNIYIYIYAPPPLEPTFLCCLHCKFWERFRDLHGLAKKWCVDVARCQFSNMFQTLVDNDHEVMSEAFSGNAWKGPCQVFFSAGSGVKKGWVLSKGGVWEEFIWWNKGLIKKEESYQEKSVLKKRKWLKRESLIEKRHDFFKGRVISKEPCSLKRTRSSKKDFDAYGRVVLKRSRMKEKLRVIRVVLKEGQWDKDRISLIKRKSSIKRKSLNKREKFL